ncbi:hypothetical protein RIF29_42038 [Crotalaria pallida]|uniref:Uncharacterized protein n=1 Tax=Crotalaria pallida TaxID=3830 RepID=A0AAN9E6T6_CROPI
MTGGTRGVMGGCLFVLLTGGTTICCRTVGVMTGGVTGGCLFVLLTGGTTICCWTVGVMTVCGGTGETTGETPLPSRRKPSPTLLFPQLTVVPPVKTVVPRQEDEETASRHPSGPAANRRLYRPATNRHQPYFLAANRHASSQEDEETASRHHPYRPAATVVPPVKRTQEDEEASSHHPCGPFDHGATRRSNQTEQQITEQPVPEQTIRDQLDNLPQSILLSDKRLFPAPKFIEMLHFINLRERYCTV